MPVIETHLTEWAGDTATAAGVPDTHANRSALAAWALAATRDDVTAALGALTGPDATEDQQRIRQALAVGADASSVARAVAGAGGADFTDFIAHVLDGDLSMFDPAVIEVAAEVYAAAAAAEEDAQPATRGDMRALTDVLLQLAAAVEQLGQAPAKEAKKAPATKKAAAPPAS